MITQTDLSTELTLVTTNTQKSLIYYFGSQVIKISNYENKLTSMGF